MTSIWIGVALILLTPLVVTDQTLFPFIVGKAVYFRSLVEMVFALWVVLALTHSRYRVPRSWLVWILGIYLVINVVSSLLGVSFQRSMWGDFRRMGGVFDLIHWLLFLIVLVSVWRSDKHWRWLLNANLGVALTVSVLGLLQHFDIRILEGLFWYFEPEARIDITFGNPTYVAAYTLVNSLLALGFLAQSYARPPLEEERPRESTRRRRQRNAYHRGRDGWLLARRVFWGATTVLGVWVLTLSGTRGAAIGLVAGLLWVGVGYLLVGHNRKGRVASGAAAALTGVALVLVPLLHDAAPFQSLAGSNVMLRRIDSALTRGMEESSVKSRFVVAKTGLEAFTDRPLFGWGPENFAVAFDHNVVAADSPIGGQIADQAHNKPVEELTTKGLLGFLAYAALVGGVLWVLVRYAREDRRNQLLTLFIAGASLAYVVQNFFLFDTQATLLQFMLLVGWSAAKETGPARENPADTPAGAGSRRDRGHGTRQPAGTEGGQPPWLRALYGPHSERKQWMVGGIAVVLAVLTVFSVYTFNFRAYNAAKAFPVQSQSLDDFVSRAEKSFQEFPPLATLSRQFLFDTFAEHWRSVGSSGDRVLFNQLEEEGREAIRSEPQNPRVYLSLARLYQRASEVSPEFPKRAQELIEDAQTLAPGMVSVQEAQLRQIALVEGYPEAVNELYRSIQAAPESASALSTVRRDLESALKAQIGADAFACRWEGRLDLTLEERAEIDCPGEGDGPSGA